MKEPTNFITHSEVQDDPPPHPARFGSFFTAILLRPEPIDPSHCHNSSPPPCTPPRMRWASCWKTRVISRRRRDAWSSSGSPWPTIATPPTLTPLRPLLLFTIASLFPLATPPSSNYCKGGGVDGVLPDGCRKTTPPIFSLIFFLDR